MNMFFPSWQTLPGGNRVPCSADVGHWSAVFPGGDTQETQVITLESKDQTSSFTFVKIALVVKRITQLKSAISCECIYLDLMYYISRLYCAFRSCIELLFLFFSSERDLARHRASGKPPPIWRRSSGTRTWITGKEANNCYGGTKSCLQGWEQGKSFIEFWSFPRG